MKKLAVLVAGLVVGASAAYAATELFRASGAASYVVEKSEHGEKITQTETRFFEQALYGEHARFFKVTERAVYYTGLDGYDAKSVIESYTTTKTMFDTKSWTAKVEGGSFKVLNDDLVQVTESGCCGSSDRNMIMNAETGTQIVTALDGSATELEVPNSKIESRYLAVIQDEQAPQQKGTRKYVGSIGYFTKSKVKSVVRVYAEVPEHWGTDLYDYEPLVRTKDEYRKGFAYGELAKITLWSSDKSADVATAFAGLGLQGKVSLPSQTETFSAVISSDRFSKSLSKASSAIELEFLNF